MTFKPRPYQVDALDAIWNSMQSESSQLLVAATGAGKTYIFAKIIQRLARDHPHTRILVLVDREVLVTQTSDKICKFAPELSESIGFCCASVSSKKELDKQITIASRQTLINQLDSMHPVHLCIVDEAHLARIPMADDGYADVDQFNTIINRLYEYNQNMRLLGCTATPYRLSQGWIFGTKNTKGCKPYWNDTTYQIGINKLISDGFLCPIQAKTATSESLVLDLASVKITAGEFNLSQLSDVLGSGIHLQSAVDKWKEFASDRKKTLAFCVTIDHAELLSEKFNENGIPSVAIHSQLEKDHVSELIKELEDGKHRVYCSVAKLTTGLDVVDIDCIMACRPTKSTALWIQMIGRGLRIADGKNDCLILDLVGNFNEHGTNLDKPKVFYKLSSSKKKDEEKETEKQCPECSAVVHIACRVCGDCWYRFVSEKAEYGDVVLQDVIVGPDIRFFKCEHMTLSKHTSKNSGKQLLKISLFFDDDTIDDYTRKSKSVNLWCCFPDDGYSGYAVHKMIETLYKMSDGIIDSEDHPKSVDEFMDEAQSVLDKPEYLKIEMSGKYPELIEMFYEVPEEINESINNLCVVEQQNILDDDIPF